MIEKDDFCYQVLLVRDSVKARVLRYIYLGERDENVFSKIIEIIYDRIKEARKVLVKQHPAVRRIVVHDFQLRDICRDTRGTLSPMILQEVISKRLCFVRRGRLRIKPSS